MPKSQGSYWIIGAGRFGKKAVTRLSKKYPEARLTLVDRNPEALEGFETSPVESVCHEGASYLFHHLQGDSSPDWVVPAVPVHLALEWVQLNIMKKRPVVVNPVPKQIQLMLPNPVRGGQGQILASYADFVCPDNCSEPFERCTFTGKPRKGLLYKTLETMAYEDFLSVVIQSHHLAAGVGGYRPEALWAALRKVEAHKGPVLFSTACLCHGVIHALKIS